MSIAKGCILILLNLIYAIIMHNIGKAYNNGTISFTSVIIVTILLVTFVVMPSWTKIVGIGNKVENEEEKKEHLDMMGIASNEIDNIQVIEIKLNDIINYIITNIATIIIFILLIT